MMPGQSSKKSNNNFDKIKREMSRKKNKAESAIVDCDGIKNDIKLQPMAEKQDMLESVAKNTEANMSKNKKIEMIVFRIGEVEYAFNLNIVKEIIRVPSMTKIPNAPQFISGLCCLRGELLPVVDSRILFGMPGEEYTGSSRIIVADIGRNKVGLIADKISEVISIDESAIKETPDSIKGFDSGVIDGVILIDDGKRMITVLNARKILELKDIYGEDQTGEDLVNSKFSKATEVEEEQIVVFDIGSEEYAIDIQYAKEIIRMPNLMKIPNTASHIEGVFSIRNQIMAVINPARIFGMRCKEPDESTRVVIINNGSFSYGVIVDKVSHVIRVQKDLFKDSNYIAYCSDVDYIKGVYNLNNGKRMVMMLDPEKLICKGDLKGVIDLENSKEANDKLSNEEQTDLRLEHVVVFKLGKEEYGIEISSVQEINRLNSITHFPGAPAFVAGMLDLRGDIIPILNMGHLLSVNNSDSYDAPKFLVVEFEDKRIGILVDSVSELLRIPQDNIEEAPDVLRDNDSFTDRIAKLNDGERIIMLLNLSSLFSAI